MLSTNLPKLVRHSNSCTHQPREAAVDTRQWMQSTIDKLESDKASMTSTIGDLRQLISRLSEEHVKEAERHIQTVKQYETQLVRLQKALKASEQHAGHFDNISAFWDEFVN